VEWLAGETEVIGEIVPPCRFVLHKSHMTWPGLEPEPPRLEAGRLTAWATGRPTKMLHAFLFSPIHDKCPTV
jgi:hypothetical protein